MPTEQSRWGEEEPTDGKVATKRSQDEAVGGKELGTLDMPAEDGNLVAQGENLALTLRVRLCAKEGDVSYNPKQRI